METSVPLEFVGEAPAIKVHGGVLVKVLRELQIEVLPKDLPQSIEVDVSVLTDLDSQISVKDLKMPEGVKSMEDPDEVVASISQSEDEVGESSEPADISQVEIEKKGKKEESEEGASE